ncbi:MAG TPA: ABC transporter ATP-binding protein [Magnetospirillum sp.]|nr:ABC transporter ATP-binding protein [Magnetospirillum sp.]
MLQVESLARPGLHPLSFRLAPGECMVVRGPSGAGKSLLLRAMADLDPATGQISLDGHDRMSMPAPRWRHLVGYVPAEPGWWADRAADHFLDWNSMRPMAGRLGLPEAIGEQPVNRLSTGERQRLALLRALERRPRVLLLDEPTAALDPVTTLAAEALLAEHRRQGLALVWVSHDPAQAARIATRHLVVEHGRVREEAA